LQQKTHRIPLRNLLDRRPVRIACRPVGVLLLLLPGCLSRVGPLPPPATRKTLACVLTELERLGYAIDAAGTGATWFQATRVRNGSLQQVWIRLSEDGRRPAWIDVRASGWDQWGQVEAVRGSSLQAQNETQAAVSRCGARGS
jgi:hypothetical protein